MVAKDFEVGDLVWAKMKGYPDWPAKIVDPPADAPNKKAQHYVYFFGSKNYSWMLDERITHHSEEMLKNLAKKKYFGYKEGVEEIINESKVTPKKPKVTNDKQKEKVTKPTPTKSLNKMAKENGDKVKEIISIPKKTVSSKKSPAKSSKKRHLTEEDQEGSSPKIKKGVDPYTSLFETVLPSIGFSQVAVYSPDGTPEGFAPSMDAEKTSADVSPAQSTSYIEPERVKSSKSGVKQIGFLGLGMMGQGMVKNLLNGGHPVMIWNRTLDKCDPFCYKTGAIKAMTPAEVVKNCDITFCCVSDPHAVKTIVFGDNGVLKGFEGCIRGEKGYVEMTSVDADTSQGIAEAITDAGMKYLEAPIIGSRKRAEDGTILILGSGDRELFNDCESCFHAMSNHAYYISCEVGKSANINIITSMFLGTVYAALAEALSLTERIKLSQVDLLEILGLRGITAPLLTEKAKAILEKNFKPDTYLKHQQKDLNLALHLSNSCDQPMPIASAANETYKNAKLLGCSDFDAAAVFRGVWY